MLLPPAPHLGYSRVARGLPRVKFTVWHLGERHDPREKKCFTILSIELERLEQPIAQAHVLRVDADGEVGPRVGCQESGYCGGRREQTVGLGTLKRGAEAPREVLPIVSHLSADS